MRINVGIVGYGNLGKAVESEILKNKNLNLVAIFSRRKNIISQHNTFIDDYENITLYKNKIEVMLVCTSSFVDGEDITLFLSENFCTIDAFDNHKKMVYNAKMLSINNKKYKTISILSCGWDPGLLSIIRGYFFALSNEKPVTFWGKGISMGHTNALKSVDGVIDGVQFTVPNREAIKKIKSGKIVAKENLHTRQCFVVAKESSYAKIERDIKKLPDYFLNQTTFVNFVSAEKLAKLKRHNEHSGQVFSSLNLSKNKTAKFYFSLKTQSNAMLTAKIMILYIEAIKKLKNNEKFGCYFPSDIPISYLMKDEKYNEFLSEIC